MLLTYLLIASYQLWLEETSISNNTDNLMSKNSIFLNLYNIWQAMDSIIHHCNNWYIWVKCTYCSPELVKSQSLVGCCLIDLCIYVSVAAADFPAASQVMLVIIQIFLFNQSESIALITRENFNPAVQHLGLEFHKSHLN